MNARLTLYLGWAAFFSGIASIVALISLLLFFGLEASAGTPEGSHYWGPISDISPIFQMLSLLIVALGFYSMLRTTAPRFSLISCMIGIAGMVGVMLLQILLRLKILPFEQEVTLVLFATTLVGGWLMMISLMGRQQKIFPLQLAWLEVAIGAAFILEPIIFTSTGGASAWRVFMSNYLFLTISAVVFLVSYIGFPIWAFWLSRIFLKTKEPRSNPAEVELHT